MVTDTPDWQRLGKAKLKAINQSIPEAWLISSLPSNEDQRDVTGDYIRKYLSKDEIKITEALAPTIVEKTSTGQWTAEEVARAFCHRASIAHQLTNCFHETFFDAAIKDAKALDDFYSKTKKSAGPLHGLPVSLKDQFHVKDVETTMGYIGWIGTFQGKKGTGQEKVFESELVKELRDLGAVLYCKTSVPHTLMAGETVNNIIGYTWNPKNRNLSCGGSSGGEGALIGLRGSPVGFGTDIGGSIRIPAAFNGLYGLRPSSGRIPYEGMANSMDGQNSVLSVVGPLAPSVNTLQLIVRALLSRDPWLHDPLVHEIPWREDQATLPTDRRKLSFAVLRHDGVVAPHPPVRRAVEIAVKALEAKGHRVIDWKPPSHKHAASLINKAWTYDNGADSRAAFELSGEPPAPQLGNTYSEGMTQDSPKDAIHIAENNVAKREFQKEYMEYWNSTAEATETGKPVDALIMPVAPFAAARPNSYRYYGYSIVFNLLDYTACTFPVTLVDKNVDLADHAFNPLSEVDKKTQASYRAMLIRAPPGWYRRPGNLRRRALGAAARGAKIAGGEGAGDDRVCGWLVTKDR
ncbi:MAG: hypothetical protein L6R37_001700 [Teloschistes peruensis]|nr:MAG: hypothetical protein L6R37_001700 [Teloschistes peruensis]